MNTIDLISDPHQTLSGAHMATYKELIAQKAKLEEQIENARAKELETVIQQVRQTVAEYGLSAEDLGLAPRRGRRAGSKAPVPAKYRDPKTGATWSGRGRAPAWIGKNRDKFLIA
ncbi:H-NS histone family protein [Arthrobacter sp. NPDC080086]|uniref:H-NS histone family protein n=2 Tax=Bacteria TaxID=2 RepID=UPI00344F3443